MQSAAGPPESRVAPDEPRRRRPRDRKAQILAVAGLAFSERGYHRVSVNDIATELGISGPALYRHFPNKYALFVATAEAAARNLLTAAETGAGRTAHDDPATRLDAVLRAIIAATVETRFRGGLYRWERRYLRSPDRHRLRTVFDAVNNHVAAPLRAVRPALPPDDVELLATAALSAIGSITVHHTPLAAARMIELLAGMSHCVLGCTLGAPEDLTEAAEWAASWTPTDAPEPDRGTKMAEGLVDAAVRIIGERGYHEASMEEIAAAVGINASGVYRHFPSKADLLAAALYRASFQLTVQRRAALGESNDPRRILQRLSAGYVALAYRHPELLTVYYAEFANLPDTERTKLRALQRGHVGAWAALVGQVRGCDPVEAQFRVHAALGLVLDLGRFTHFDERSVNRARITVLMQVVLLDDPPAAGKK